jgi:ubiquinone/menaquinone biosynthesis C-methylase UbiE|tara:strand:+ start:873 stop:1205 length:333 start_codon:yes stop_codon:yes gene_type:complete
LVKRNLIEHAGFDEGMRDLDLAAGTGTLSIMIKRRIASVDVTCVDGDPKILEIAERNAREANVSVDFDNAMATNLPYPDSTFDRVVSTLFFHHLNKYTKSQALLEVFRVI